jgi:hypothetical protein
MTYPKYTCVNEVEKQIQESARSTEPRTLLPKPLSRSLKHPLESELFYTLAMTRSQLLLPSVNLFRFQQEGQGALFPNGSDYFPFWPTLHGVVSSFR